MRILAAVFFLIFSVSVHAIEIKPSLSGSWYNPAQNGHGFSIEVLNKTTSILYWYVYDHDGEPIFLIAIGENEGNRIEANAYYQDGLVFGEFDPANFNQVPWGTVDIEFHSCKNATVSYDSDMSHSGQVFGSGSIPLQRLASIGNNKCVENELGGNYQLSGIQKSDGMGALGLAMVFENDATMYYGVSAEGGFVGFGYMDGSDGKLQLDAVEMGLIGSNLIIEHSLEGEYLPGAFSIQNEHAIVTGTEVRHGFMQAIPPSNLTKKWDLFTPSGAAVGEMELKPDGSVEGRFYGYGCDIDGIWSTPNSELNQHAMELNFTNCNYEGFSYAAIGYNVVDHELIVFGLTDFGGYIFTAE